MTKFFILAVLLIIVGCGEDQIPISSSNPKTIKGEIIATLDFDECIFIPLPSSGTLDSLCGKSSILTITFEYVYPDQISEFAAGDLTFLNRNVQTGDATWKFTNSTIANVLLPLFSDSAITFNAYRVIGEDMDSRGMTVTTAWFKDNNTYTMAISSPLTIPVDPDGYPILDNNSSWSGTILIDYYEGSKMEMVRGHADMTIKNLRDVPVDTTVTSLPY